MIKIYYLKNCPHSLAALETLEKNNIKYEKIESSNNKEEQKKRSNYSTFPQIYWKIYQNEKLIGGNDNFTNIIRTLQSNNEPSKLEGWTKKEWYVFLLNIVKKLN